MIDLIHAVPCIIVGAKKSVKTTKNYYVAIVEGRRAKCVLPKFSSMTNSIKLLLAIH